MCVCVCGGGGGGGYASYFEKGGRFTIWLPHSVVSYIKLWACVCFKFTGINTPTDIPLLHVAHLLTIRYSQFLISF